MAHGLPSREVQCPEADQEEHQDPYRLQTIWTHTGGGRVESAKYLGLTISNDMMWNVHIGKTVAKGNSRLGFPKRNLNVKSPEVKEKAYKALICPTLKYCCSIWDPPTKTQSHRVEIVQCRAARWVTGCYHNTLSVDNMLRNLEWRILAQRRANYTQTGAIVQDCAWTHGHRCEQPL